MVVINIGADNTFAMTLSELATIENPSYLMVLEDKQGRTTNKFFLNPVNSSSVYQKFELEEGVDETILAGDYNYSVYQKSNQDDEDIPSASDLLETGILRSLPESEADVEYTIGGGDSVVYDR